MVKSRSERYLALDILRGVTVAGMILVNNPGSWGEIFSPLRHAAWAGCTPTDLVFPTFLFIVGVAMALSFAKHGQRLSPTATKKLLVRGALIFLVGLLLNIIPFHPSNPDPEIGFWANVANKFATVRILGVLQRIALCYIVGGLLALWLGKRRQIAIAMVALMALHWLLLIVLGDASRPLLDGASGVFSLAGQGSGAIDIALFGQQHVYHGFGVPFDPEGLLGVLSGSATLLLGFMVGEAIRTAQGKFELVSKLYTTGLISLALAVVLSNWIPIIKALWTPSFVLYAGGWSTLLLALAIYLVDIKGYTRGLLPFRALGINPLFAFVMAALFITVVGRLIRWSTTVVAADGTTNEVSYNIFTWFYSNVCVAIVGESNPLSSLIYALSYVAIFTVMAIILYRKRIVIKL